MKTCMNCKYSSEWSERHFSQKQGVCRYNPPTLMKLNDEILSYWPDIYDFNDESSKYKSDWCGKFEVENQTP